jgi:hypothetical protein
MQAKLQDSSFDNRKSFNFQVYAGRWTTLEAVQEYSLTGAKTRLWVSVVVLGVSVVTWRVLMRLAHGSSTLYFIDFSTTVLVL